VDRVTDELSVLLRGDEDNCREVTSDRRLRDGSRNSYSVADYSLVSRAWVNPTQKHHFRTLWIDSSRASKAWVAHITPDPTGVSRHVRELQLDLLGPSKLEDITEHLNALTRIESLTMRGCGDVSQVPSFMEWLSRMGSNLVRLQITNDSRIASHSIVSLLAVLPLLKHVEMEHVDRGLKEPEDADEANPPTAFPQVPFFEGVNSFILRSADGHYFPDQSLDWIPPTARFWQLELDLACSTHHPELANQWLASSCATLRDFTIGWDCTSCRSGCCILLTRFPSSFPRPPTRIYAVGPLAMHRA
jgi:hypothetical protein